MGIDLDKTRHCLQAAQRVGFDDGCSESQLEKCKIEAIVISCCYHFIPWHYEVGDEYVSVYVSVSVSPVGSELTIYNLLYAVRM